MSFQHGQRIKYTAEWDGRQYPGMVVSKTAGGFSLPLDDGKAKEVITAEAWRIIPEGSVATAVTTSRPQAPAMYTAPQQPPPQRSPGQMSYISQAPAVSNAPANAVMAPAQSPSQQPAQPTQFVSQSTEPVARSTRAAAICFAIQLLRCWSAAHFFFLPTLLVRKIEGPRLNFSEASRSVTELHLGKNQVGDDGAGALADAAKASRSITELHLGKNQVGDDGAGALADAVKASRSITELHLGKSQVGDDGAGALADAVKESATLKRLSLFENRIADEGRAALWEAKQAADRNVYIEW